jgi:hypothetical protein
MSRFNAPFCAALYLLLLACSGFAVTGLGAAAPNRFDGPAELPRVTVSSSMADTPAPGRVHLIKGGDDLQDAINSAACGDTLALQAGAVFQGVFRFPQKSCDDSHWIILRSAAPDGTMPSEGTRLTPCYAGVASLPGRPDYHCAHPQNVMAKIEITVKSGIGPFMFLAGANHYRFIGLEITRADSAASVVALAMCKDDEATAHHLIFDRVWMHGNPRGETRRGIHLTGMTYVAVINSYFSDFHCIAGTGSCTDSQTVSSGGGDAPEGPFKIENNFLEAAGENIIFGGRRAKTTPADIEIRRNHFFKPLIWMRGQPGFVGGEDGHPFIVKNLFELKNAERVLFEENLLENSWGGFSQSGFAILLMPTSQQNGCPSCMVADITIRSVKIVNVASGFSIANVPFEAGGLATAGARYSIHDVALYQVRGKDYQGFGLFAMFISNNPLLRDVHIEHVTSSTVPRYIISIIGINPQKMANFVIANSIFSSDQSLEIGSGGRGFQNCAYAPDRQGPSGVFDNCFQQSSFTHNLVIGGWGWPAGNITPKDFAAAGIRITDDGQYHLCRGKEDGCKKVSPAIGAATDGRDIGADLPALEKIMQEII